MANVNVTYGDMQSAAGQLRSGESQINSDLARLKKLIDNLVASGYVTDSSSKQFQASYEQFNSGATKMIAGLNGMGQYLDTAAKAFQETDTSSPPRSSSSALILDVADGPPPATERGRRPIVHVRREAGCGDEPSEEGTIMRLALTVVSPAAAAEADVVLDADPATRSRISRPS